MRLIDDPRYKSIRAAGFPTVNRLRNGITLNCIASAFWLAANEPVFHMFWNGDTYFEDQLQGEQWSATFTPSGTVVLFFSSESTRKPFLTGRKPYDLDRYFVGMPEALVPARDRALNLMMNMGSSIGEPPQAVITAAMWSDAKRFTAVESWDDVLRHSLCECCTHLLPPRNALFEWWQGMSFPVSGRRAAWSIYRRRQVSAEELIYVEPWEWEEIVKASGKVPKGDRLASAKHLLESVGVSIDKID